MSEEFYSVITQVGLNKIQNALATGTKLDLKYIAVGDSNGSYYEPDITQTSLVNEKYRAETSEVSQLEAKALIPNNVGGFYIREIGIIDSDNDLILVAKQPETYKPIETQGSVKELWIKVIIRAINSGAIQIKVDPSIQYASTEWVTNLILNHSHLDLMPIWIYDRDKNGIVDTCDVTDGGRFTDGDDLYQQVELVTPPVIMSTGIYDLNDNGIVDAAENVDAGTFADEEEAFEPIAPYLASVMSTTVYDKNKNGIIDNAENIDAGNF